MSNEAKLCEQCISVLFQGLFAGSSRPLVFKSQPSSWRHNKHLGYLLKYWIPGLHSKITSSESARVSSTNWYLRSSLSNVAPSCIAARFLQNPTRCISALFQYCVRERRRGREWQNCFLIMGTQCIDTRTKLSNQRHVWELCTICFCAITLTSHHLLPFGELTLWFEGT